MGLIAESNMYTPQNSDFESNFLMQIDTRIMNPLNLPTEISEDVKGIINAVNHNVGINKFLFEGLPGSGKTEVAKHVARLLDRTLFCVDFDNLIDSKLGQTNKNISSLFNEINMLPHANKVVILFDEIDVIALDRINSNDVREMGCVTSTILRELDRLTDLNKEIVIIATTNLFSDFDKALIRRFDAVINFNRYSNHYNFPIPIQDDKYPYVARATMCYFPVCDRTQGVDYTNTELNLHFGRIKDNGKICEINDDKQNSVEDEGSTKSYILEGKARKKFRKWDNVKYICEKSTKNKQAKQSYKNKNWRMEVKTNNRLDSKEGIGLRFGVVVTLKEIHGVNRIDEFVRNCHLSGWLVNTIDIQNRVDIYEKVNEEIEFS